MPASSAWNRLFWGVLLAALLLLPNLFAIQQYRATGYLFYSNAYDEETYLSYDGASMMRSPTRLSEYLVVALQDAGLSGGQINLLFDIVFPLVCAVFLRRIATTLGFSTAESNVYALAIIASPVLLGSSNPYYLELFNRNYYSWSFSWVTLPQAYFPPFFRSPEPQCSLCIAAIAVDIALRRRSYVIALGVAPFLYPFIAIPYTFVALALLLFDKLTGLVPQQGWRSTVAIVGSYGLTGAAVLAYFTVAVSHTALADFLPATRWPLVSGTGVVALVLYLMFSRHLRAELRVPALFIASAPWAMANTQVITGFLQVPHDLEQCFGVVAVGILLVFAVSTLSRRARSAAVLVTAAGSCWLLGMYSAHVFLINSSIWQRLAPSAELLTSLRDQPESLVMAEPSFADVYTLIAPRLHLTALSRAQAFLSKPNIDVATRERFDRYLCTKRLVEERDASGMVPRGGFVTLDRAFRYLGQDFPPIHLNRKTTFKEYFDPSAPPVNCSPRPLKLFPVVATVGPLHMGSLVDGLRQALHMTSGAALNVGTPKEQWAYAAMTPVVLEAENIASLKDRLMNLRVTATVTKGCAGVGVLNPDQRAFAMEAMLPSAGRVQRTDLLFTGETRSHWMVVRNCASDGPSSVTIHTVELFFATGTTVTSIGS